MVDVITNSSTELFLLDTNKSIEMIKEIVLEKEKEFPSEQGYHATVRLADEFEIQAMFGYYDDEEVISYLKARGYTITPPKNNKSKHISISIERGYMNPSTQDFIHKTFNVIHYTTKA